jgi:ribonuclease Z
MLSSRRLLLSAVLILPTLICSSGAQTSSKQAKAADKTIEVILLGTGGGPPVRLNRSGISTLIEAGGERFLFDAGRGFMQRLVQAGISVDGVTKLFITHLHSDHVVDIPDLLLTPWSAPSARKVPLEVWGPEGTGDMMDHLQKAFAYDIHIRRDVDEKFSPEGIKVISHDISEGTVYEKNGVKITAFLVDHGPVKPSFGYRLDYQGHSVAISGDTRPNDNLVKFCTGVDVLIHEAIDAVALRKIAANLSPSQFESILGHHTTPEQAGQIFSRVKPRLAVYSHISDSASLLELTKKTYPGRVEVGEDLMTIKIGDDIEVSRPAR